MSNLIVPRRSLMLGGAAVALMPAIAFADGPDVGKPAPLFTAVDSNGKTWSLADLKGKVVVIETTNQDCPYVRKHYTSKNMQTQQREAAAKGVVWLTSASSADRRARLRHRRSRPTSSPRAATPRRPPCCSIRKARSRAPTAPR